MAGRSIPQARAIALANAPPRKVFSGDGRLVTRSRLRREQLTWALMTVGGFTAMFFAVQPAIAGVYLGVVAVSAAFQQVLAGPARRFAEAMRLQQWDQAEALLSRVERRAWRGASRARVGFQRGTLRWVRGDLEGAFEGFKQCLEWVSAPTRATATLYWINLCSLISVVLEYGDSELAERLYAITSSAPARPLFAAMRIGVTAHRAFVNDRPEDLGDDDRLRTSVDQVRAQPYPGVGLAMLAWVSDRRGDDATATALLRDARASFALRTEELARMYPRFWAWLGPKLEAARDE